MHSDSQERVLAEFSKESVTLLGTTRTVFRTGEGPAVIVIHELPGITPLVAAFARKVAERNLTAVMPSLFGTPGKDPSGLYIATSLAQVATSRAFSLLSANKSSGVTRWLRSLAEFEHERCGGPGVGAVGMCLTGTFALAMMVDPVVVTAVLSQPTVPIGVSTAHRRSLGISPEDLATIKHRVATEERRIMGMRFASDRAAPAERFERLSAEFGDRFTGIEIDIVDGNPWGYRSSAHCVLTQDYSDSPGSPTRVARDQVLDLLAGHLRAD